MAPVAVPAGLALAAALWAWRIYAITTGLAGQTASAPVSFDARQWRHQVRTARGRAAAPGTVPLLTGRGRSRSAAPSAPSATGGGPCFPSRAGVRPAHGDHRLDRQREDEPDDAAVGRLVHRHPRRATRREGDRPLLIVLDCKGGPDARVKADRTRRLLHGAGARRVAIWPDEARLSLWDLPPADLAVLLLPDDRDRRRRRRLLRRHHASRRHPRRHRPRRPARASAASFLDRLDAALARIGLGRRRPSRRGSRGSAPPPGTWATSSSATPPCSAASAPPWTAPAPWPTPTSGTSSWKAPASRPSPKPRPWR